MLLGSDAFGPIATVARDIRCLSPVWATSLLFLDVVCEFAKSLSYTTSGMQEEDIDDFLCNIQTRLSAVRVAFALVLLLAWWMESGRITAGRKR